MAKDRVTVVVPNENDFKPANILFGVVSGDGVPDYNHVKSGGKRGEMQYSVTLQLGKKEAKDFKEAVLSYWEDHAPKDAGEEPINFGNILRKDKEDEGMFLLYAKSKTQFDGKANIIPIVNHEGTKLDPAEYGSIGKGSKGRLAVTFSIYEGDDDYGVSVYLSAVKLTKFVAYEGSGGASAFGAEDGEVDGAGGFKSEKSEKKKDKKDKKKKHRDEDDEDQE